MLPALLSHKLLCHLSVLWPLGHADAFAKVCDVVLQLSLNRYSKLGGVKFVAGSGRALNLLENSDVSVRISHLFDNLFCTVNAAMSPKNHNWVRQWFLMWTLRQMVKFTHYDIPSMFPPNIRSLIYDYVEVLTSSQPTEEMKLLREFCSCSENSTMKEFAIYSTHKMLPQKRARESYCSMLHHLMYIQELALGTAGSADLVLEDVHKLGQCLLNVSTHLQ